MPNTHPKIFAGIVAGGLGSRLSAIMPNSDLPKQFISLNDKPIFLHSLETIEKEPRIERIYLGVHPDWLDYTADVLTNRHSKANTTETNTANATEIATGVTTVKNAAKDIVLVAGGTDRNGTVSNIIKKIRSDCSDLDAILLSHDAARPFVSAKCIKDNIDAAIKYGAATTALPATDTIIRSDEAGEFIYRIPTRDRMYQAQTPQTFRLSLFEQALSKLGAKAAAQFTDASKVLLEAGVPVRLVAGEQANFKITTEFDLSLAQAILRK